MATSTATDGQAARRPWRIVHALVAAAAAVALLWWLIPIVSKTTWSEVWDVLGAIAPTSIAWLCVLWLVGLLAQGFVLTGALPGLSHTRALTLNLTGSAVSNIAPMGGALGVVANLHMTRTWRFRDTNFATFTIVSNVWDVLSKLLLPLVALIALAMHGDLQVPSLRAMCIGASILLAVLLAAVIAWLASEKAAVTVESLLARGLRRLPGRLGSRFTNLEETLAKVRGQSRDVVRAHWQQMTLGMVAYLALQALLLWACLHYVGVDVAIPTLLVAFALERLGTLVFLTPGGVGVGEAATLAVLVALGSPGAETTAGLLLFRCFTYLIEIPVGGAWLGGWLLLHRRKAVA